MKAIKVQQFGDPKVMNLVEVSDLKPSENQIKIKVESVGVNPVDTYIRAGIYPLKPELPYTPGSDAAGVISELGSAVEGFQIGQRVYNLRSLSGTYAEEMLCQEGQVFALPDQVDFNAGAALGVPYTTAYFALNFRAQAVPGETVLIHGASGSVGQAAIQIAKGQGLRVIGTAGTASGIELIKKQGVSTALNHNEENYLDAISDLTDGKGVDVILEMLANVNLVADLTLMARFGRIVVIGNRGSIEIDPRATMGKNGSILGMSLFNATYEQIGQIQAAIHAGLSDGRYQPTIHTQLPLVEAPQAHDLVMQSGINGKIILIP